MEGARAALRGVLRLHLTADFAAAIVFIDVLAEDNIATAAVASRRVVDHRVRVFHDPNKRAGRSMARTLGWQHHIAWDCYLYYPAGVRWDGPHMPPAPRWIHQLRDREVWEAERPGQTNTEWTSQIQEQTEALSYRFRTGGGLVSALRSMAAEVLLRR